MAEEPPFRLVSVVIPLYNSKAHLDRCLESVLTQDYPHFEVLLIDDGSTDGTLEYVRQRALEQGERMRVFHHENHANKGVPSTRNLGVAHARGEYIALIDQDDVWEPTKLSRQVPVLDNDSTIVVCHTHVKYIDGSENIIQDRIHGVGGRGKPYMFRRMLIENTVIACSTLIRKDALVKVGMFPANQYYYEDWLVWLKLSLEGTFHLLDEVLAYYRVHPGSTMEKFKADDRALTTETTLIINFYTYVVERNLLPPWRLYFYRRFSIFRALFRAHSLAIAHPHIRNEASRLQTAFPGDACYIACVRTGLSLVPRKLTVRCRRVWRSVMKT